MSRLVLMTGVLALALAPSLADEPWDCGASTGYSNLFKLDTEVSDCTGWTVASPDFLLDTIWNPGSMKRHPRPKRVTLIGLPVTRAFAARFYIEAIDRSSGIGVIPEQPAGPIEPGTLATVRGTISELEGEIVLAQSPEVTFGALDNVPEPLGMTPCALRPAIGLDPSGLLATIWGRAVSVPDGKIYYLISDGYASVTVLPEGVLRPEPGDFVILTGVPGFAEIEGEIVRVFRLNAQ